MPPAAWLADLHLSWVCGDRATCQPQPSERLNKQHTAPTFKMHCLSLSSDLRWLLLHLCQKPGNQEKFSTKTKMRPRSLALAIIDLLSALTTAMMMTTTATLGRLTSMSMGMIGQLLIWCMS